MVNDYRCPASLKAKHWLPEDTCDSPLVTERTTQSWQVLLGAWGREKWGAGTVIHQHGYITRMTNDDGGLTKVPHYAHADLSKNERLWLCNIFSSALPVPHCNRVWASFWITWYGPSFWCLLSQFMLLFHFVHLIKSKIPFPNRSLISLISPFVLYSSRRSFLPSFILFSHHPSDILYVFNPLFLLLHSFSGLFFLDRTFRDT